MATPKKNHYSQNLKSKTVSYNLMVSFKTASQNLNALPHIDFSKMSKILLLFNMFLKGIELNINNKLESLVVHIIPN